MGRLQQFRARAIALRGAIAVGGALVMAAGLVQASDTLAQDVEVREATAGIATQNYFPTPLASDIACDDHGAWGSRRAEVSWTPPEPAPGTAPTSYRYRVDWADDDGNVRHSFETSSTSTGTFRIRDELGVGDSAGNSYRIRVHTINTENDAAVSSGYRSHTVHSGSSFDTYCTGDPFPISDAPNAAWENQYDWDTSVSPESKPAGPISTAFATNSGGAAEQSAAENTTTTSTSATAPSSSPQQTTSTATAPSSSPSTTPSPSSSTPSTLTTPTPATTTTTAPPPVSARAGGDPIAVGASQARLEAGDQTRLIVTRSGSEVCAAEVDGASRIESADGVLTVTVSGGTTPVDLETCELT